MVLDLFYTGGNKVMWMWQMARGGWTCSAPLPVTLDTEAWLPLGASLLSIRSEVMSPLSLDDTSLFLTRVVGTALHTLLSAVCRLQDE